MRDKTEKKNKTGILIIIAVFVLILLIALFFVIHANSYIKDKMKKYDGVILDNVSIEKISVAGMTKELAKSTIDYYVKHNAENQKIVLKSEDVKHPVKVEKLGIEYDIDSAVNDAYDVCREGSIISNYFKLHAILDEKESENIKIGKELSDEKSNKAIKNNQRYFNRKPINAKIALGKKNKVKVIKEKNGLEVKIKKSSKALSSYIEKKWDLKEGTVKINVATAKPSVTTKDFKNVKDVLGKYSTKYDTGYYGRRKNIECGAKKINGTLIKPGEKFSVYKTVGPFNKKNGYYLAGTYAGDQVIDGYGGGICQVSTTLYNAAIRAELKITERHNHGMTIHYVPLSFDAAISGGKEDLKFKNNLKDPVYLYAKTTKKGKITFAVLGKERRDKNRKIKFKSKVLSVTPPGTRQISDNSLPQGTRVVEKYGVTGYSAELWKTIYVDGKKKKSYKFNTSHYNTVNQVVRVGTKKAEKKKKKDNKSKSKSKKKN